MTWVTRDHWLWGLLLPSRLYLVLAILGLAGFFTTNTWVILVSILLLAVATIGFSIVCTRWRSFALSIMPGERVIWERRGFSMTSDRRINLEMIGSVLYRQTTMGHILDYGALSITAVGGPYEWENLGQFQTLRRIIESQGEWTPLQRTALQVAFTERLSLLWLSLRQSWERLVRWWRRRPRSISASAFNRSGFSAYERFLHYAGDFLFPRNVLHFNAVSDLFGSPGSESSLVEGRIFWHILKLRRILIVDKDGRMYRHPRIRSMQDIQQCIPAEWFDRYFHQYQI